MTYVLQFGFQSPSTWVCPVGVTTVKVECWGGGGGGAGSGNGTSAPGGGGGGGGYSQLRALTVTPGTSYTVTVGAAGTAGSATPTSGGLGGDSWFSTSTTILAKGGTGGTSGSPGGAGTGGAAGSGIGDITTSGGNGAAGVSNTSGGGGGGSGGNSTSGGAAVTSTAGSQGATVGGKGGVGGTSGAGKPGNAPGGGGGGDNSAGAAGTAGAAGLVQLTYTADPPPTTSSNLINSFNAVQYSNVSVDDGDYFITKGSTYLVQEYKNTHPNNTDNISFTWMGRSTVSTLVSPILIQIYNVNSAAWETLATINTLPADVDSPYVTIKQTTNLSNYYDSTNTVTFRSYQKVV